MTAFRLEMRRLRARIGGLWLRRTGALVFAVGIIGSLPPGGIHELPERMAPAGASDSQCWDYRPAERGFARNINLARAAANKSRLSLDPELSKSARKHTSEMVGRETLYHTASSALRSRVTNWSTLGENVGVGGDVESLHSAFMHSPAHRDNILYSTFRHVGIGVRQGGGRMWVTVIFEATSDPGTRLRMPSCR